MTKQELSQLVAKNEFKVLVGNLEQLLEAKGRKDLADELTQLQGQYHHYEQHRLEGTKNAEALGVEAAQLRRSFMLFIDQLFAAPLSPIKRLGTSRWLRPVLIVLSCLGLILVGSIKWPSIDFELEGRTTYLAFRLNQDWDFGQDLYLEEFSSFTVQSLSFDTFEKQVPAGEPLEEVILYGGQIKWEEIDLPAQAVLTFELAEEQLISQVLVDSLRCRFALRNAQLEMPNLEWGQVFGSDSTLVLAEIVLSEGPQMAFIPNQDSTFAFRLVPVSGLEFQRSDLEDDRGMKSEIIDGQVISRGISYDLKDKPFADIIEPEATTLSFYQQGNHFKMRVQGKAKDLIIGAHPNTQESVKPTVIEHLAKSANANLFWNWVMGIIGVVGGIAGLWPRKK